ncbi:MAG: hypothetical protein ACO3A2_09125 [Bdellovibrionia bacterium]
MSTKTLKVLTGLFGFGVLGIAVSLVMTVILGVQDYRLKHQPQAPHFIPTPAQHP